MLIVFSIFCVLILLHIYMYFRYNKNEINDFINNEKLNKLCESLPPSEIICSNILKDLNNDNVKIKLNEDINNETSLYNVFCNEIVLCNNSKIKDSFARVLFISHECWHSVQNKLSLKYNYILAILNVIYWIVVVIFRLTNLCSGYINVFIWISICLNIFSMLARIIIESDATYMSINVSRKYLEKYMELEKVEEIVQEYQKQISNGYPMFVTSLVLKNIFMIGTLILMFR